MCKIADPSPHRIRSLRDNQCAVGGSSICNRFQKNAVFINSENLSLINEGVKKLKIIARKNPDCHYLVTPIGIRRGDNDQKVIALRFLPVLFMPNVHLPEEYIRYIAYSAHTDVSITNWMTDAQLTALRDKWRELRKQELLKDKPKVFSIFDNEKLNFENELIELITDAEAGVYNHGENLNEIRVVMECVFERLAEMGFIGERALGSDSECGKAVSKNLKIPQDVRTFVYAIIGVVNPGSHAWLNMQSNEAPDVNTVSKEYRNAVNTGNLRYLTQSLVYMTLNVIEWCAMEWQKYNKNIKNE